MTSVRVDPWRPKISLASFLFRQGVQDLRSGGTAAMLLDDLAKEDDAFPIDQEGGWICRFVRRVPTKPVQIGELVARVQ
jgi:hypothetical protein